MPKEVVVDDKELECNKMVRQQPSRGGKYSGDKQRWIEIRTGGRRARKKIMVRDSDLPDLPENEHFF